MKPSELKAGKGELREAEKPVPVNVSRNAKPPITAKETEPPINYAICPWHNGLIAAHHQPGDLGKVFYCPVGEQFYRFQGASKMPIVQFDDVLA